MLLNLLLVAVGFALLIKGADFLVDSASAIAKRFNVSELVIGLTIVAFGTSTPELVVSSLSAFSGNSGIAIGNVLGSNVANICLVLGVGGIILPITISKHLIWKEIPFCALTSLALVLIVLFFNSPYLVSRYEALILLLLLGVYTFYMFKSVKPTRQQKKTIKQKHIIILILMLLGGLAGLIFGGQLIVENAIAVAKALKVSEELIGVTIIAVGTSLPEVATSVMSVIKKKPGIAVGNVVGSNILNTCLVLGTAALIKPIVPIQPLVFDAFFALAALGLLFVFMFLWNKYTLDRIKSSILLACYVVYILLAIYRG
jgi:cation:H+ antiporter